MTSKSLLQPKRALARAAVVLALALPTSALAQPEMQTLTDASCMAAECHPDVTSDAKHVEKDVGCVKCHPNAKGDGKEHAGAMDDTPPEVMCATAGCHPDTTQVLLDNKHNDASCDACHGFVHEEFKRTDMVACRQCHKKEVGAFTASAHAKAQVKEGDKPVECGDCHGDSHRAMSAKNPDSPMSKWGQLETCVECHDTKEVRAFRDSEHGRGLLKAGLKVSASCSSCHGAHDMTPVKDEASRVSHKNISATCGDCHTNILASWKQSVHGKLFDEGKKTAVCTNCHSSHGVMDPQKGLNRLAMTDTCEGCHKEEHATYRDFFHGKATQLGLASSSTCADCHTAHKILPADDPRSSVHLSNLNKTCGECHGDVNASFVRFQPHLDFTDAEREPGIHYVWFFMTALLIGTLGFFSIHTLLWLQRAVVAYFRGELKSLPHDGEVWVRRFRPVHIWTHVFIVSTFLALAATGLPLKFSYTWWASPVEALFGGLAGARVIHRLAGVITFGYGAVFLGYLVREIVIRKRRELLFGWQSMVPNKKDLVDLLHNLRWFFYLGERPKLDRWAYWEKFDFFAVFWGVPVIGLSGLMLWIPNTVTKVLPGWTLNLAYLIHSDEALLATGFIFFFHFFHTHLRPEAFPMDPVIFTGSVPLERFKEERPAEYERLVKTGELEKYLMPPPTERQWRWTRAFGFSALATGTALGLFLMVTGVGAVYHRMNPPREPAMAQQQPQQASAPAGTPTLLPAATPAATPDVTPVKAEEKQ